MGTIVAIGGGEFRKGGTRKIDEHIIELSKKKHPSILFIPTASKDSENYIGSMKAYFSMLNCNVEALCLVAENNTQNQIKRTIMQSDIVYVGGGDTAFMMEVWKKYSVDQYLKEAFREEIILCGLSAGSICWFRSGYSDHARIDSSEDNEFGWCEGLGLLPFYHCPHYDEPKRRTFDYAMEEVDGTGIALEKGTALIYINGKYEIFKSSGRRSGYLISREEEGIIKRKLKDASLLNELF